MGIEIHKYVADWIHSFYFQVSVICLEDSSVTILHERGVLDKYQMLLVQRKDFGLLVYQIDQDGCKPRVHNFLFGQNSKL